MNSVFIDSQISLILEVLVNKAKHLEEKCQVRIVHNWERNKMKYFIKDFAPPPFCVRETSSFQWPTNIKARAKQNGRH